MNKYKISDNCNIDLSTLEKICTYDIKDFGKFGQVSGGNIFIDNGADVLAVAHLDVAPSIYSKRKNFVVSECGEYVFSPSLDDRLGVYTILYVLPQLGINVDVLLTRDEEVGNSTAQWFETDKDYRFVIEFDRRELQTVMYHYTSSECTSLLRECGIEVGWGTYTDICELDFLEAKCFNFGIGYRNEHTEVCSVFVPEYKEAIGLFLKFWEMSLGISYPHTPSPYDQYGASIAPLDKETEDDYSYFLDVYHGCDYCSADSVVNYVPHLDGFLCDYCISTYF